MKKTDNWKILRSCMQRIKYGKGEAGWATYLGGREGQEVAPIGPCHVNWMTVMKYS